MPAAWKQAMSGVAGALAAPTPDRYIAAKPTVFPSEHTLPDDDSR